MMILATLLTCLFSIFNLNNEYTNDIILFKGYKISNKTLIKKFNDFIKEYEECNFENGFILTVKNLEDESSISRILIYCHAMDTKNNIPHFQTKEEYYLNPKLVLIKHNGYNFFIDTSEGENQTFLKNNFKNFKTIKLSLTKLMEQPVYKYVKIDGIVYKKTLIHTIELKHNEWVLMNTHSNCN